MQVVFEHAHTQVAYCGIVVKAGTRHEEEHESGMAHFIEHTTFKGTQRRKAWQLNGLLERRGGDISAYTTKQETVYYATVLKSDVNRAADVLTDMVFRSTYPQQELNREKEVICDEIESYKDSPAELIFDEFEAMLHPADSMGRDILGEAERLRTYTTADALHFARRHYQPCNCVFYAVGDISFPALVRQLERLTADLVPEAAQTPAAVPAARLSPLNDKEAESTRRVVLNTHQAHVVLGARTVGGADKSSRALLLLNNYLGGPAQNSRFNVVLREKAGLVYSVDSYIALYPDVGSWSVYFGCDKNDIARCNRLIRRELSAMAEHALSPRRLEMAREQLIRQLLISCDAYDSYARALGKTYANYGRLRNVNEIIERLRAVTAEDVRRAAETVFSEERLHMLVYV